MFRLRSLFLTVSFSCAFAFLIMVQTAQAKTPATKRCGISQVISFKRKSGISISMRRITRYRGSNKPITGLT
jgi:hypothetical protein